MFQKNSLQRKLSIGLALGVVVLWSVATLVSTRTVRHEIDEIHELALEQAARRVLKFAHHYEHIDDTSGATQNTLDKSSLNFIIRDKDGKLLLTDPINDERENDGIEHQYAYARNDNSYTARDLQSGLSVEVTDQLDYRQEALRESMAALIAPLPLLVPLSLLLVWLIVKSSFGKVELLRERIEARDESDLTPLPTNSAPTELQPMVNSINALMERLDRAIRAERDFASNSAHELRTPIATALAGTDRLIKTLPEGDSRERARQIKISLTSLASLTAKLMQLARAESGLLINAEAINQSHVLNHVLQDARTIAHGDNRLDYRVNGENRFMTRLDPDGLAILLRNLLENALKHSLPDTKVEVVLDGNRNQIRIINEGPIVPQNIIAISRQRFVRGNKSVDGAGLGLSIVDAITRHSGVKVQLLSPATDKSDGVETIVLTPL